MEWVKLISEELVKWLNVLAWPGLIGIAVIVFRKPISALINNLALLLERDIEVGSTGVKVSRPQQQTPANTALATEQGLTPEAPIAHKVPQPVETASPSGDLTASPSGGVKIARRTYTEPFVDFAAKVEESLDKAVPEVMERLNIGKDEALKYLAIDQWGATTMERASRRIYGSQLEAIDWINVFGGRVQTESLRSFYTHAAAKYPPAYENYTFEQWLVYMASWELITLDGADVVIEPAGKAIKPYMQSRGYLEHGPIG